MHAFSSLSYKLQEDTTTIKRKIANQIKPTGDTRRIYRNQKLTAMI